MKTFVIALMVAVMAAFSISSAAPAHANAAHCRAYVSDVAFSTPPAVRSLTATYRQTCTGGWTYHQVKGMIQKYTIRNNAPDGWVNVAQNYERAYQPKRVLEIKVRYQCNPRAPKRTFRAVGTFMMKMPSGNPAGRSVRSLHELKASC